MDLKNNIALITGGASGLGRGTVEHFVSRGCKVAILDINDDKAKEVIDLLGSKNVTYVNTDVMSEESVTNAIKEIKQTYGKLNFIVNCAGTGYGARILGKNGPHPLDIFKFIIDLNFSLLDFLRSFNSVSLIFLPRINLSLLEKSLLAGFEVFFVFNLNKSSVISFKKSLE